MRRALVVLTAFSLLLATPLQLWADSEGPNSPGTVANDAAIGTIAWTTFNNAKISDNIYAFASVDTTDPNSNYLKATNFSFTLSGCSSIDGITVENERNGDGFTNVADLSVKVAKGGTISGNEKALVPDWPATDAIASYGGASDLWGLTWLCSDITGSGFGAGVACQLTGGTMENCRIDHIKITVTFTATTSKLLITESRTAGKVVWVN